MKKFFGFAAVLVAAMCSAPLFGQEFTSVDDVKADGKYVDAFQIQGEYVDETNHRGYQVIARGEKDFVVIEYQDGLPGDGWDRSKARFFGKGEFKDGQLVVTGEKMNIPRKGDKADVPFNDEQKARILHGTFEDGKYYFDFKEKTEIKRVERKSPTLGMKAPEGAIVLFDGSNTDAFDGKVNVSDKQENAIWSEARIKPFEKDRPYTLHLEFMLSFMPNATGQARSNSGVYLQEEYECQVLDSFGLEGENNECAGFYQQLKPIVNACFPPLTWQTYDFDVTPAKFNDKGEKIANAVITVKHNGILVHDKAELAHETPGGKTEKTEAGEARGVFLQGHGNKVQYRNIWIKYND
ncbi:MAG: DUF1080 domain-containing protein [Thermoguttaceae bacterium]|nr:DUF1080 domain-containing protein [Thermoguttaceae bacterium]